MTRVAHTFLGHRQQTSLFPFIAHIVVPIVDLKFLNPEILKQESTEYVNQITELNSLQLCYLRYSQQTVWNLYICFFM